VKLVSEFGNAVLRITVLTSYEEQQPVAETRATAEVGFPLTRKTPGNWLMIVQSRKVTSFQQKGPKFRILLI